MTRLGVALILVVLAAAPLAAATTLDFPRPVSHRLDLFVADDDPPRALEAAPDAPDTSSNRAREDDRPEPRAGERPRRELKHWFSRGVGIGVVGTAALVFPGAGIGLEVSMPIQREASAFLRVGMIGTIFFEGGCYDLGVRGFFDISEKFTLYINGGVRMTYGRILDYAGGHLEHPIHRFGLGGFAEGGLEFGSRVVRFFAEVTINGVRTFDTEFQVGFFCGVNFGVRFYIG
ncbi:MAG: hypothetical protein IT462_14970 [Planctomycetes bacterium]|nr:hypothetical protein [Planctomycetota bacterium]